MFLCDIKYSGSDVFHDGFLNYIKFMSNKTVAWLGRFFRPLPKVKFWKHFCQNIKAPEKTWLSRHGNKESRRFM